MATRDQLVAWKTRGPECNFDKPVRRHAHHREHLSAGLDLFNADICNVTQLLPLDAMEHLYKHHLSNNNNKEKFA